MKLSEIEALASRFNMCPKCGSKEGFWFGVKSDHVVIQCKTCGASFEFFEALPLTKSKKYSWKMRLLRR
ncbi:MAG: hypothetical protein ACPLKQ_00865 [Candidatus Bathyarchaeales archaeon]